MPTFARRAELDEMMDDFTIVDARLTGALDQLREVNRFLGGYGPLRAALKALLHHNTHRPLRLLDVGTGVADVPEDLVRWGARNGRVVEVVGLDANPATVVHARSVLDARLPPDLRGRVEVVVGDALALPYEDGSFDATICSLFLHHFDDHTAPRVLREMDRVARHGLVVSDLHRHPLAYASIRALVALLPVSPMFRHDGPVSVLRAFRRRELKAVADAAGLVGARVHWHWAFRWTLSTVSG